MIRIDLEKARTLLRAAMETQGPDFVYNPEGKGTCMNIPDEGAKEGDPRAITGCLIGTMITGLGISMDEYELKETNVIGAARILSDRSKVQFTQDALVYLMRAQNAQDNGKTWGEAVTHAEETISTPLTEKEAYGASLTAS